MVDLLNIYNYIQKLLFMVNLDYTITLLSLVLDSI